MKALKATLYVLLAIVVLPVIAATVGEKKLKNIRENNTAYELRHAEKHYAIGYRVGYATQFALSCGDIETKQAWKILEGSDTSILTRLQHRQNKSAQKGYEEGHVNARQDMSNSEMSTTSYCEVNDSNLLAIIDRK